MIVCVFVKKTHLFSLIQNLRESDPPATPSTPPHPGCKLIELEHLLQRTLLDSMSRETEGIGKIVSNVNSIRWLSVT